MWSKVGVREAVIIGGIPTFTVAVFTIPKAIADLGIIDNVYVAPFVRFVGVNEKDWPWDKTGILGITRGCAPTSVDVDTSYRTPVTALFNVIEKIADWLTETLMAATEIVGAVMVSGNVSCVPAPNEFRGVI